MGELSNMPIPDPHVPPNPQTGVSKSPPFKFQPTSCTLSKMSIEHILEDTLAGCAVMQWSIIEISSKPQMSDNRSSTICVVIERPDHHCGDDLVCYTIHHLVCTKFYHKIIVVEFLLSYCNFTALSLPTCKMCSSTQIAGSIYCIMQVLGSRCWLS